MTQLLYPKKARSALKEIRLSCAECMGMSRTKKNPAIPSEDIRRCTDEACPLYEWRFGKNPYHRGSKGRSAEAMREMRLRALKNQGAKTKFSTISPS